MTVIQSDRFNANNDVSMDILLEHEVDGLGEAPLKLANLNRFDDREPNVIMAIYLDVNGIINEAEIGVAGGEQSRKLPADQLFHEAPAGSRLRLRKFKFQQYKFPPGRCYSEWVNSDDIDWAIMRSNNMKDGTHPDNTHKDIGVGVWVSRLHVTTCQEANRATVRLVAIPRTDLENLPGTATGIASEGYPVIMIGEFPAIMAGETEENRSDGIAFYPCCINRGPADITTPTSEVLRVCMSTFWSNTSEPNCLSAEEWVTATQGPQEPEQSVVPSEWVWPQLNNTNTEEEDEDSGE